MNLRGRSALTCYGIILPTMVMLLTLFAVVVRLTFPLIVAKLIHSLPRER